MKTLIKNNEVIDVQWDIPHDFNKDGVVISHYCHAYTPEVWYEDGWRDVIIPEYNKNTQRLGKVIYDSTLDKGIMEIIDTVVPEIDINTQKLGEKYFDEANKIDTYPIIELTAEELIAKQLILEQIQNAQLKKLNTLTKYQFLTRFTPLERISIITAAKQSPEVELFWEMFKITEEIDLTNPETITGINMLVSLELLTSERGVEILKLIS